jgi:hypothetical protein
MIWDINRIARCGGLNELNREQRRCVRESLRMMYQNGGKVREHRCSTNAPLLSLMDFVHRDGRIIAFDGTVDNSPHSWCQIDNRPFEITFPLVIATEASARQFTLSILRHNYEAQFRYEWTGENFGRIVAELFHMTHPSNGNLSPEDAAILLKLVGRKLGMSLREKDITGFAESARKVRLESDRIFEKGCRRNETVPEFQKRWGKEVDHLQSTLAVAWMREYLHGLKLQSGEAKKRAQHSRRKTSS